MMPPTLVSVATIRNTSVTDSPGWRPWPDEHVTVAVPAGHVTDDEGPLSVSSGSPIIRDAPTALTPGGRFTMADTGSDGLPPLLVMVNGRSAGPAPGTNVNPGGDGTLRLGGAGVSCGGVCTGGVCTGGVCTGGGVWAGGVRAGGVCTGGSF